MLPSCKVDPLARFNHATDLRDTPTFAFSLPRLTVTMWFSPRALKSCWRSSSRPDTRWSSRPRALFGLTDIWRTNTPMSGRATGSSAQGVGLPSAAAVTVFPFIWKCTLKNAIVHIWDLHIKTLMTFSTFFLQENSLCGALDQTYCTN